MTEPSGSDRNGPPTVPDSVNEGTTDAGPSVTGTDEAGTDEAGTDEAGTDEAGTDVLAPAESGDDPGAAGSQVAAALAELHAASGRPPADQVAAFAAAHETLQATLARIDDH